MVRALIIFLSLAYGQLVSAATINLEVGASIQDAINAANGGDLIELAAGNYKENIVFEGKAITIRGVGKDSIIKGDGNQATVKFIDGENSNSVLDQVTVTGGFRAGAILVENASPRISRCWIIKNKSLGAGSGVYVFGRDANGDSAEFSNNIIAQNKTRSFKPGNIAHAIYIQNSSPSFINNTIIRNDRSAFLTVGSSSPQISNNIIAYMGRIKSKGRNRGRGVNFESLSAGSNPVISHNLFFRNRKADFSFDSEDQEDINSVVVPEGFNITLNGNIMGDPSFVRLRRLRDLNLGSASAAIDAGDPDASFNDSDNSRNDIGASGGPNPIDLSPSAK